jgi:hypothetical protein
MTRARIRAATLAVVCAAGLVAVAPVGVAHADICHFAVNPSLRIGPGGCINPAYRFGVGRTGGAPSQGGVSTWPPSGGPTWPPS